MSETTFVFDAESAPLLKASKSIAAAASQIERSHVAAGKAANAAGSQQMKAQAKVGAGQRELINAAKAAGRVTNEQARDAYRAAQVQARGLSTVAEATEKVQKLEEDLYAARARGDRDAARRHSLERKFTAQRIRDLESQKDLTRKARLETAERATRFLPGRVGGAVAGRLATSGLSGGAIAGIGAAATALGGVAVAAVGVVAAYKAVAGVLRRNTELQAAQDRIASASVQATATAQAEYVKNMGALDFASKQRIVSVDIPQLQRDLKISGFNDLVRAVGAATSAGGSTELAVSATRQAALLYPFDPAATQVAGPQLALIAKALGDQNAQLATGIVLATNQYSPVKDVGLLAQSLPSIFSAARRLDASASEFGEDAKFAAALFASIASESADTSGDQTKTLLRTLIPLVNRFYAGRSDVGTSLSDRFNRLTTSSAEREKFLAQPGIPGGSQQDLVEKLFAAGSPLNTGVQTAAGAFQDLRGAAEQYSQQIKELTATTKIAVQQQRLMLSAEERARDPSSQARGTIQEVYERAQSLGFSDDEKSIGKLAFNRMFFEGLMSTDAFRYGSSEEVGSEVFRGIDRMIESLESGGVTTMERRNIEELKNLKDIVNQTVQIDRQSRVPRAEEYLTQPGAIQELDQRERAREKVPNRTLVNQYRRQDEMDRKHGLGPGNRVDNYLSRIESDNLRNLTEMPADPVDRAIRQQEMRYLQVYRAANENAPAAVGALGNQLSRQGMADTTNAAAGMAGNAAANALVQAAEGLSSIIGRLDATATAQQESAENLRNATRPRQPDHRVSQRARAAAAAGGPGQ